MSNVNFYLKKAEPVSGKSLIYLQFKYNGNKLTFAFGQTINPKDWNKNKQRVKSNKETTTDGKFSLNDLLDNLETECLKAYNGELKNGIPTNAVLKSRLSDFINQQHNKDTNRPTFHKLLNRFIGGEIKFKGKEKSPNTIKTYKTFQGHLSAFEKLKKCVIDYDSIDLNFLYKYISFLRGTYSEKEILKIQDEKVRKTLLSLPIGQNAIAKDVQILKTIMKKAVTFGETNNVWHQHEDFTAERQETDAVYLTTSEIKRLFAFDLSYNKRLEQVRDLFVFGCCVGLRFSDYSNVKEEYIQQIDDDFFIKMITQKTSEHVTIPCGPMVLEIFDKYSENSNKLPTSISNQKFNDYIKEVCKLAGLTQKGKLASDPTKPLYECISSHTARRSFATNLYLESFPVIDLMKITGHRTERAFMTYIKHSKLEAAKRLSTHMKKTWNEKLLKVA